MKLIITTFLSVCFIHLYAIESDSTIRYHLPNSVSAVSFITNINFQSAGKNESFAGIKENNISLSLETGKRHHEVSFQFPSTAIIVATGVNVKKEKDEMEWKFDWQFNTSYKLLLASAVDSAENFVIYSGYIFLPEEQKWKLIGSCRINGQRESIKEPAIFFSKGIKSKAQALFSYTWIQKEAGSWQRLDNQTLPDVKPVINPLPNIDSIQQFNSDRNKIVKAFASSNMSDFKDTAGVFYKIINPGSGKTFTVSDSITVHYQLRIFGNSEVISGSDKESYTFPLRVLIKAWQIAVPLVKTGGKIKLIIPSGLGYSIRTRASKIPPNSILEFDIEVLEAMRSVK
jgi:FKBP-type peptidyl-prolyl cis-trans isomerase FkpA